MSQSLLLCVYHDLSLPTFVSVTQLLNSRPGWKVYLEAGDALISRARSMIVSQWLLHSTDDVFLMSDADFQFTPEAAESIVELAREKRGIAAGVTPLRSGEHTAIVPLEGGKKEMWLTPDTEPFEIRWAGGLLAYHRDVFEKLAETLPLLHQKDAHPEFYPFFMPMVGKSWDGRDIYLSEDYACHERAREAGFKVWVQPKAHVGHLAEAIINDQNMHYMRELIKSRG